MFRRFAVLRNPRDRHLDDDAVHVGAAEAVDAERIFAIVGVFSLRQKRQRLAAQIDRVENRAEIDIESFRALPSENFDAGRWIGINPLRREIFVFLHGRRSDIGRHGDQLLSFKELGPFMTAHFGDSIGLPPRKSFRARDRRAW